MKKRVDWYGLVSNSALVDPRTMSVAIAMHQMATENEDALSKA